MNITPHPDKVGKGGEDALLASHDLMVVADGVGGWAKYGIDPGLYPKQLVADFKSYHDDNSDNDKELLDHLLKAHE